MVAAASAAGPVGFSVPSTKPSRSRSSKYLKPWTSSTTLMTPASRPTTREASSQHRSMVAARMWNKRSPGVATAVPSTFQGLERVEVSRPTASEEAIPGRRSHPDHHRQRTVGRAETSCSGKSRKIGQQVPDD